MKILSISAQKPHSTGSGGYLTELVRGFHELGAEQAVIAGVYKEDAVEFPIGVKFYPVYYKSRALPFAIPGMSDEMPYESSVYSELKSEELDRMRSCIMKVLERVMIEFQPDIILCHHLYLVASWIREKYPDTIMVGISHGTDVRQMLKTDLERAYIRNQIQQLDRVFVLHEEMQRKVQQIYGCITGKMQVVGVGYNGKIFNQQFRKDESKKEENKKRAIQLIFAGKISEKKGIMSLLRAISNMKNANIELSLAGGYGKKGEYREICLLAHECGIPVNMLGMLSQEQLSREFQKSDIFILPSFYEGLPLVIIEALACGLYIVATDLPGVRCWINRCIPTNDIRFVKPPKMENADEVITESLPEFERELTEAIYDIMQEIRKENQDDRKKISTSLQSVSWQGVSEKIYKSLKCLLEGRNEDVH